MSWILDFDWHKSPAHLLLLSKFIGPKKISDFLQNDSWEQVLHENPRKAIQRLINDRAITNGDLVAKLEYQFTVPQLRGILKEYKLPTNRCKAELVERLIQSDIEKMKTYVVGLEVFKCTEYGRSLAEQYKAQEKSKRENVEKKIYNLLKQKQFRDASLAVSSYLSQQVFPSWKDNDTALDEKVIQSIFDRTPKAVSHLPEETLDSLRIAAAMMRLWGTNKGKHWLPVDVCQTLSVDPEIVLRSFLFAGLGDSQLDNYRRISDGVIGVRIAVQIRCTIDSCEACKSVAYKTYSLDNAPSLPIDDCTHKKGCRCCYLPITMLNPNPEPPPWFKK
jgi:hypothetical protein